MQPSYEPATPSSSTRSPPVRMDMQTARTIPLLLIGGLAGCDMDERGAVLSSIRPAELSNSTEVAAAATDEPRPKPKQAGLPATPVTPLPLRRGYYVASDTACGAASNATAFLLQRGGIGGSRDFCEFRKIEQIGPHTYRVLQSCRSLQDREAPEVSVVTYTLSGDAGFTSLRADGWTHSARLCTQASMPAAWRHNDIRDALR